MDNFNKPVNDTKKISILGVYGWALYSHAKSQRMKTHSNYFFLRSIHSRYISFGFSKLIRLYTLCCTTGTWQYAILPSGFVYHGF